MGVSGAAKLNSTLGVSGAALLNSTLGVSGAAKLNSTLGVSGAALLNSTLGVSGAAKLNSTLGVSGAALLNSTLGVSGAALLNSTLGVSGAAKLNSTLGVSGATEISNTLSVFTGATVFNVNGTETSVIIGGGLENLGVRATDVVLQTNAGNGIISSDTGTGTSVVTGGTTDLTLNDSGATFSNGSGAGGGAPVTVTGVADGVADFDAVNVRQLHGGLAAVIAMTQLPAPAAGQQFSIGIGLGVNGSQTAVAVGMTADFQNGWSAKTAFSHNDANGTAFGLGVGFGW